MNRIVFIFVFVCLHMVSFAQKDSVYAQQWKRDPIQRFDKTHSNQKQIITAEQIRVSGYGRLSDILQLSDAFTFATVNGDRWSMQLNGTYQNQNWILMLDGQRIQLLNFDAVNINTIGVPVNEIERIEIIHTVGNYLGEFTDKGLIHIVTKTKSKGITYSFLATNGNEIGDPGPFRFTPQAASNVDKIGLNYAHTLHANYGKWQAKAIYQYQDYFFRDEQILQRAISFSNNKETHQNTQTGRLQLIHQGTKIYHQIDAFQSKAEDVLNLNAVFYESRILNEMMQVGYLAQYKLGRNKIQFKTSFQNQDITRESGSFITHNRKVLSSNLNYTRNKLTAKGNQTTQYGIASDFFMLDDTITFNFIRPKDEMIFRPYFAQNLLLTKKSNLFFDASLGFNPKQIMPKLSVGYYKQPTILNNWSLIASYTERSLAEDQSIFHADADEPRPNRFTPNINPVHKTKQAVIDYYFNINTGNSLKFSFNSSLKYLWDEPMRLLKTFAIDSLKIALPELTTDYQSFRWVNRFNFHYDLLRNLIVDLNYMHNRILINEEEGMLNIPKHRWSFIVNYSLPKRFNLWSRVYYQSSTRWINFQGAAFTFDNETIKYVNVSNMFNLDVGVSKKIAKDYLNLNLSVRNLLNTAQKYHTIGAQFDLTFFVGVSGNISAFAKK
jgi:hypothetical protein